MTSKLINIRRDIIATLDKIREEENLSYSEVIERLLVDEPKQSEIKAFLIQKIEDFF
jgi:predicted CopG family antitoxin